MFGAGGSQPLGGQGSQSVEGEHHQQDAVDQYLQGFADVIDSYEKISDITCDFNFKANNLNLETLRQILNEVFEKLAGKRVIMYIQVGYLLRHVYTGVLRWFYPSLNTSLGQEKYSLTCNQCSLQNVLKRLGGVDWVDYLRKNRQNSVWLFVGVTNIRVLCYLFRPNSSKLDSKSKSKGRAPTSH